ncbi:MAG: hypothetical protein RL265_1469, partial [Bacteroidota bacterium]
MVEPKKAKIYSPGEIEWAKNEVYEKALTVLKNAEISIPLQRLDRKIAMVSIGNTTSHFRDASD